MKECDSMDNSLKPELPKEIEPATPGFILQSVGNAAKIATSPAGIWALGVAVQTMVSYAGRHIVFSVCDRFYSKDEEKCSLKKEQASQGCSSKISRAVSKASYNLHKSLGHRDQIDSEMDIDCLCAMQKALVSKRNTTFNQGTSHGQKKKSEI